MVDLQCKKCKNLYRLNKVRPSWKLCPKCLRGGGRRLESAGDALHDRDLKGEQSKFRRHLNGLGTLVVIPGAMPMREEQRVVDDVVRQFSEDDE